MAPFGEFIDFIGQFVPQQAPEHQHRVLHGAFQKTKSKGSLTSHPRYSLNFNFLNTLNNALPIAPHPCDIVLSENYSRFIVSNQTFLSVYRRAECPISFSLVDDQKSHFDVCFGEWIDCFKCLKLVREKNEEFIYASTTSHVVKIRVSDVVRNSPHLVWKSSEKYKDIRGIDVLGGKVFVMDCDYSIRMFNCENGDQLESEKDETIQCIKNGYGIHCFSENEILLSHETTLELFVKHDGKWQSIRKTAFLDPDYDIHSIFYEKASDLIYMSVSGRCRVIIVKREDFSIVKTVNVGIQANYGMLVDPKSGLLYVCDHSNFGVLVYH